MFSRVGDYRLVGNPYCRSPLANGNFCQQQNIAPYSTNLSSCGNKSCAYNKQLIPVSCGCAVPLTVNFTFIAPTSNDVSNMTLFQGLEQNLWNQLNLAANSVRLRGIHMSNSYLLVQALLFPSQGTYFNLSDVLGIVSYLSNQQFNAPQQFGPYTFILYSYGFLAWGM